MKILIPIVSFARSGGSRVLSELANHWIDAGHHVDFLADSRTAPPYFPTRAGILLYDDSGLLADGSTKGTGFAPSGNGLSIYRGMWRGLRDIAKGYDVVLANHSLTAFPVAFSGFPRSARFFYIQAYEPEYFELEKGWKQRVLQAISATSFRLPLTQIANSDLYIGYKGIRARHWIPPGINERVFHRRSDLPGRKPGKPWTLGTIGRREPGKGTRYALEAFELLAARDPDIRMKIAYGNLPEGWTHERAEVVVPCSDGELAEYYRSVDIMVAPGTVQFGAFHYPVLESMACGTPVITTDYRPATDSNAWKVPPHDGAAIAAAAEAIMQTTVEELQRRLDLAAAAAEPYRWHHLASRFVELFSNTDAQLTVSRLTHERRE